MQLYSQRVRTTPLPHYAPLFPTSPHSGQQKNVPFIQKLFTGSPKPVEKSRDAIKLLLSHIFRAILASIEAFRQILRLYEHYE
jgi:hypothetical protein